MSLHDDLDRQQLLLAATGAARLGGDVLMRHLVGGVEIRDKSADGGKRYDLVSDADLESEQVIAAFLKSQYPDHELLGEETLADGNVGAEHLWVIDPLDGTNNFAHDIPHFAVSIAYYHRRRAVVAAVLNPARDEMFTAILGQGAFFQGDRVWVSRERSLKETLIGCGFYYDRGEMMRRTLQTIAQLFGQEIHGIRRFGTAALDLCYVGCGQFGGFFEYQLSPWDFAAGQLFIEEAGGRVTDGYGRPLELKRSSLVASNGHLHDALIEITTRHHP
jgi:myo-inositol-1(or 4)-monophosphatase